MKDLIDEPCEGSPSLNEMKLIAKLRENGLREGNDFLNSIVYILGKSVDINQLLDFLYIRFLFCLKYLSISSELLTCSFASCESWGEKSLLCMEMASHHKMSNPDILIMLPTRFSN